MNLCNQYNRFVRFVGDILITDPCYIIREDRKMNYKAYPKMEDYYSKYKIIGDGHKGYPTPDMYEDVTWIDMKRPLRTWELPKSHLTPEKEEALVESYHVWINGVKTDNPNIRKVAISLTYEAENQAYNDAVKKWETEQEDDWGKCCCGEAVEKLGLNTFIVCDTIYGDWSCTVFNSLTKEKMGEFCADSGQVGIFLMDEVLKYNPDLDLPKHCATIIKNFDGHVRVNKKNNGKYTYDGEEYDDIVAEVEGVSKTLNFKSAQTGF